MDLLDIDLVLDPEGHLTEVGIAAVADGQHELLPPEALLHADTCPRCASLVTDEAVRAVAVQHALEALPPHALHAAGPLAPAPQAPLADAAAPGPAEAASAPVAAPLGWVAGGVVVGLGGLVLAAMAPETRAGAGTLLRAMPALWRVVSQAMDGWGGALEQASQAGALALWVAGIGFAVYMTRQRRVGHEGEAS